MVCEIASRGETNQIYIERSKLNMQRFELICVGLSEVGKRRGGLENEGKPETGWIFGILAE